MDRRMKRTDFRPQEFREMDPSFRHNIWKWGNSSGHLFNNARRFATLHSVILSLAIGGLYGLMMMSIGKTDRVNTQLLEYGPDADTILKKKQKKANK